MITLYSRGYPPRRSKKFDWYLYLERHVLTCSSL
ncbi:unnamed protein product [Acanthoscelides obtectus]|uniref:Uncharacterized protein n=1 Tax=Acanthoscelides obtectus TaxID=200917 RepID=A0A9P0Q732_ACAOB|nr:unnamed protein product [Acanthoscelides obtectus]CAK1620940.1 hypothetical protein AOBTE_LOCUS663 [Acanthoscelides obtectus]